MKSIVCPPEEFIELPDGSIKTSDIRVYWVNRPYSAKVEVERVYGQRLGMHLSIGELDRLCRQILLFLDKAEKEGDAEKLRLPHFISTHWHERGDAL